MGESTRDFTPYSTVRFGSWVAGLGAPFPNVVPMPPLPSELEASGLLAKDAGSPAPLGISEINRMEHWNLKNTWF